MTQDSYELAVPPADSMIESLRAFGYTPETAIADLIDNSITARARNIWLTFHWVGPESYIAIRDDGIGMIEEELSLAMRPANLHPSAAREPGDLGRFGLGLKTASFSQGRSLTVCTRVTDGDVTTRRWDLDYVNATKEWRLLLDSSGKDLAPLDELANQRNGTVVVWEKLDRWRDTEPTDRAAEDAFLDMVGRIETHLAMVFHRFMQRRPGLAIWIGATRIEPWDPFLTREDATQLLANETLAIFGGEVGVRPYVLPHQSKLHADAHARAAGPRGWNGQQGFYVYRLDRMLVDGDWLGFFKQEEHCKLARISLDIDNLMDEQWEIDVRKSKARPPDGLRRELRRIAQITRERAVRVYRHRGTLTRSSSPVRDGADTWLRERRSDGSVRYQINRTHPLAASLLADSDSGPPFRALARLLEETVPVQQIWIDTAEREAEAPAPFQGVRDDEVIAVMRQVRDALLQRGFQWDEALNRLSSMSGFAGFEHLVQVLREEMQPE